MKVKCNHCGKSIERRACKVKWNKTGRWFCNRTCQVAFSNKRVIEACVECGTEFASRPYIVARRKKPYCSKECRKTSRTYPCCSCGKPVKRQPSHAKGQVFCSTDCAEKTRFSKGAAPWNKGVKGLRYSPSTEFKKGPRPDKRAAIGTVSIRVHKRSKESRAWVKIANPDKWMLRARLVWITANGPIPRGYIIHHKDRDTLNDSLNNLELMTKSQHAIEHSSEIMKARHG